MTRWTIDKYGVLTYDSITSGVVDLFAEELPVPSKEQPDAYQALVAAVRDAGRYQQAARLACRVRAERGDPDEHTLIPHILDLLTGEDQ